MKSRPAAPIRYLAVWSTLLALLLLPSLARASFHQAQIGEVMTSYGGDPTVQFVEIRMLGLGQNLVSNTVLAAFDANGNYSADVLVVPSNVSNSAAGVTWLMGTAAFQTASGLAPDFTIPPGLPTGGGMICWGAPGVIPPSPPSWDRTVFTNYVDCVAYGTYAGPSNVRTGTPTTLDADGHGLLRTGNTVSNDADFACEDPVTPTNNVPASASLTATTACPVPPGVCGNNIQESGEACDGADDAGCCSGEGYFGICTQCRSDCTCEFCGNSEIGPGEQCDDSSSESSPCQGSCSVVCQCPDTDTDGDGSADFEDACTAAIASDPPIDPPDQSPIKAKLLIKDLDKAAGLRDIVARGLFNPATQSPFVDPEFFGAHVLLTNGSTTLLDLGIPGNGAVPGGYAKGDATCGDPADGWKYTLRVKSGVELWKYTNRSGLLPAPGDTPPNCTGDAKGIRTVLIKFIPKKQSYLYVVTTKDGALDAEPEVPPSLTELKFNLALSVPPSPGFASEQAQVGQCVDSVFRDDGSGFVSSGPPLPFCKRAPKTGQVKKIICRSQTKPTPP